MRRGTGDRSQCCTSRQAQHNKNRVQKEHAEQGTQEASGDRTSEREVRNVMEHDLALLVHDEDNRVIEINKMLALLFKRSRRTSSALSSSSKRITSKSLISLPSSFSLGNKELPLQNFSSTFGQVMDQI
jgi:hypothetical protein